jgi:hypothetical protein
MSAIGANDEPTKRELQVEEWKECRATIGRFDTLLVDLRKYGFTLITGLLTASSFWFYSGSQKQEGVPTSTEAGVTLVLTVLVVALFVVDRTYEVLLHAAVERGMLLEDTLELGITKVLSAVAKKAGADTWASATYTLFIVAAQIPWVLSWLGFSTLILRVALLFGVLGLVWFVVWYHLHSKGADIPAPITPGLSSERRENLTK